MTLRGLPAPGGRVSGGHPFCSPWGRPGPPPAPPPIRTQTGSRADGQPFPSVPWGRALKHDYLDAFPARILSLALSGLGREMGDVFKMEHRRRTCSPWRGHTEHAEGGSGFREVAVHSRKRQAAGCEQRPLESGSPGLETWLGADSFPCLGRGTSVTCRAAGGGLTGDNQRRGVGVGGAVSKDAELSV